MNNDIAIKFAELLENEGVWAIGTDVFIGGVEPDVPDSCYWILLNGGNSGTRSVTGERKKQHILTINYRDMIESNVYNNLSELERLINAIECPTIGGDDVYLEVTSFPIDEDKDFGDRNIGSIQVTIEII